MTTIVLVRKKNDVVVASDGQVSMGNTVIKSNANKVRKIEKRNVIAGFAGSTADALTLFERLEAKLEKHAGNLTRAAVELAHQGSDLATKACRTLRRASEMLARKAAGEDVFSFSKKFMGARPGFVFKRGEMGVGYYPCAIEKEREEKKVKERERKNKL